MPTILFLDVTGVLHCGRCTPDRSCGHLQQLRRIVDALGCRIVLTTSFRFEDKVTAPLRTQFAEHGIPAWIGATPDLPGERWTEIRQWVEDHDARDHRLVIIDDGEDADLATHVPETYDCHFFHADFHRGLDETLAAAVLGLVGPATIRRPLANPP